MLNELQPDLQEPYDLVCQAGNYVDTGRTQFNLETIRSLEHVKISEEQNQKLIADWRSYLEKNSIEQDFIPYKSMDKSAQFYEGQEAACQGLTDADCPYEIGSDRAMD